MTETALYGFMKACIYGFCSDFFICPSTSVSLYSRLDASCLKQIEAVSP